ncbi:hypothetical protein V1515DRAFT_589424, partial [Lipomyces mesembrius]
FVCTVDKNTKTIVRLRSYALSDEPNIPASICQAALATSAATTFFEPVRIGNRTFADGGLGANNPVDQVEGEATDIWCSKKGSGELKPLVKCFLSIGTGNPGINPFEDNIFKFLRNTVVGIATETEETEKRFIAKWRNHYDENRYFRFNVDQGLQNIGLDEYKQQGAMESATERYLVNQAQKNRVRDCIENLKSKQTIKLKNKLIALDKFHMSFAVSIYVSSVIEKYRLQIDMPKVKWIVPFEKNTCFTGREKELTELEKLLFTEDGPKKIAVFGLGGVGKTSLTIELVYRIRESHKDWSIFWIPATNFESLQQAYLNICQQLQLSGWDEDNANPIKLLQSHLSEASAGHWLLVFDNADDISMWTESHGSDKVLKDYLPISQFGRIIFTSRDRKTAYDLVQREQHVFLVPELDESVAIGLLQKYIRHDLGKHEDDTKSLLQQLTCLPLAIVQAASYINKNDIPLAEYLSLLADQEEDVIDLLSEHFEDDSRYRDVKNPVAMTWLISFEQIRLRDKLAAEFLSFIACVDSKNVPRELLPPGLSRKQKIDAIGTLKAYSFIYERQADSTYDVHRLVHLATRNWLRREELLEPWAKAVVDRLDAKFPTNNHQNRTIWRRYLTHALYALDSQLIDQDGKSRIDLAWKVGNCLYSDGRWKEAETLLVQVMEFRKTVLGEEHPDTLESMNDLAELFNSQGKYEAAEPLYKDTLRLRKKVLGEEHPDTLTSMNDLASLFQGQGKYETAEPLYKETLRLRKKVLGEEHPNTLISMNSLPALFHSQGKYEAAEPLYKETLRLSKKVLGEEHPDTLESMNGLAALFCDQGKYETAEPLYEETLRLRKKVLGEEHPDTLGSMNNLAGLFNSQGKYEAAEPLYKETLRLSKKVLGEVHPRTLTSMNNLAGLFDRQGKYEAAEPLYEETLRLSKKVLGEEHPQTLGSMNNLAGLFESQGKYEAAEPLYKETLRLRKKVLGEEHPDTLTSMNNLASVFKRQGKYEAAEPLYKETLRLSKKVLGEEHPDTLTSMNNLAVLFHSQGKYEAAEPLCKETLRLRKKVLGEEHPATLWSMNSLAVLFNRKGNLASLFNRKGKYETAEPLCKETLRLRKKVLGEEHPDTLTSMHSLASLFHSQGKYEGAEPLYKETLRLSKKVFGEEHPNTLTSKNNLAALFKRQGKYETAEPLYPRKDDSAL